MKRLTKSLGGAAAAALLWATPASATVWNFAQDLIANPAAQVGNGAGNAWWYFYTTSSDHDGSYTLFTVPSLFQGGLGYGHATNPVEFLSGTGTVAGFPDVGVLHPGNSGGSSAAETDVIVGWRAPSAMTVNVSGFFEDQDGGDFFDPNARGVAVSVTTTTNPGVAGSDVDVPDFALAYLDASNTNPTMRNLLGGIDPLPSVAAFDFDIAVDLGQWLFFRVNDFGQYYFDTTYLTVVIDDNLQTAVAEPAALAALLGLPLFLRRSRRPSYRQRPALPVMLFGACPARG